MKEEEKLARRPGAFQAEEEHVRGGSRAGLSAALQWSSALERARAEGRGETQVRSWQRPVVYAWPPKECGLHLVGTRF